MGFNFPNSPAFGETYTPSSGIAYTWDGVAWKAVVQGVPVTVYVSDTQPPSPAIGQLWWNSATGNMAIWYADADSAQWVQVSGSSSISGAATAETRNRIVNPNFCISQENGNTASSVSGYYPADQWVNYSSSAAVVSTQRVQSVTPNGSKDRIRLTVTTADASLAAGDLYYFGTRIEGIRVSDFRYGSASAKQSILRFGWKSPAGTYSVAIQNNGVTRAYVAQFTISAGQANTDTIQTLIIPGDTTGTWTTDTNAGAYVHFCLAAGSTFQGVAGWQAGNILARSTNTNGLTPVNNVFEIFDVGWHLDPLATGALPTWASPDEAAELTACQRYWNPNGNIVYGGYMSTGGNFHICYVYPVEMRVAPAIVINLITNTNCTGPLQYMNTNKGLSFYSPTTTTGVMAATFGATFSARM